MKAIVQTGPKSVEVQQRERPSIGNNELLIEVHTAGLCGSDAHAYSLESGYEWIKLPRIMGHEYSGRVVETGSQVTNFEAGDKVIEEPIHDCGVCFQCKNGQSNICQNFSITGMHRDGAYAEYVSVEEHHVHRVPDGIDLRDAAITEPTSIATRAVMDQSVVEPGSTVLVEGPGPIGVLVALIADSMGADVLVSGLAKDQLYRLPLLEDLGIETINLESDDLSERTETLTEGIGFDVVFDTTGHHSGVEESAEHVRKGGQIVVVGLPAQPSELFMTTLVRGEVELNTSYGSKWRNFEQALRLMRNGTIVPREIVDTSFDTSDPDQAFEKFLASETCKPVFSFAE